MEEVVSHKNTFIPQILEYVDSNEALDDPATRRDYFEHMNDDDFIDMTQQVASLIRTGDSGRYQRFDGDGIKLMGHEVPNQKDKDNLLRETWATAKSFLTDRKVADEDALEYAALTVAGGLLYAHPFIDGNGRTSRLMSFIIAQGRAGKETFKAVSQSLNKEWEIMPSSELARYFKQRYVGEQPKEIDWEDRLDDPKERDVESAIMTTSYKDLVIRRFIDTADENTKQLIKTCATYDEQGKMTILNGDKLVAMLVNDPEKGMSNAQHLLDLKYHFEAEFVRNYLASMRNDTYGDVRILRKKDITPPVLDAVLASKNPSAVEIYNNKMARYDIVAGVLGARAMDGLFRARDEVVANHRALSKYHHRKSTV